LAIGFRCARVEIKRSRNEGGCAGTKPVVGDDVRRDRDGMDGADAVVVRDRRVAVDGKVQCAECDDADLDIQATIGVAIRDADLGLAGKAPTVGQVRYHAVFLCAQQQTECGQWWGFQLVAAVGGHR